jgi:hypothetical protein
MNQAAAHAESGSDFPRNPDYGSTNAINVEIYGRDKNEGEVTIRCESFE